MLNTISTGNILDKFLEEMREKYFSEENINMITLPNLVSETNKLYEIINGSGGMEPYLSNLRTHMMMEKVLFKKNFETDRAMYYPPERIFGDYVNNDTENKIKFYKAYLLTLFEANDELKQQNRGGYKKNRKNKKSKRKSRQHKKKRNTKKHNRK